MTVVFLTEGAISILIHNALQSMGLSVFAAVVYVITFFGCWQPCVMFKQVLFITV
jgi:hypothetical protein